VDSILARMGEAEARGAAGWPQSLAFDPANDLVFDFGPALKGHANGMIMHVEAGGMTVAIETYYSIGGGFVQTES
jgi:L-serine dehydratase